MFSGIVEEQGVIQHIEPTGIVITAEHILSDVEVKDSIAVDGICLTVTDQGSNWFRVDTMPETLHRTRLAYLHPGDHVNLERALPVNGRIGGHMVQGHIEACVSVLKIKQDGIALDVELLLPADLRPYVVPKGFIALNGVSLTVVNVWEDRFSISLIPYTQEHTNLGEVRPGAHINLETDILGRYIIQTYKETYSQTLP